MQGLAIFNSFEQKCFLSKSETLWSPSRRHSSGGFQRFANTFIGGGGEHLSGHHEWAFLFDIPPTVHIDKSEWRAVKLSGNARIPPAFFSKAYGWSIIYEITVDIKRGGVLSIDDSYV